MAHKGLSLPFRFFPLLFFLGALGSSAAPPQVAKEPPPVVASTGPGPSFVIADLDGDHRLDFASIEGGWTSSSLAKYRIQLQLSGVGRQSIGLLAPVGGLLIEARDVNGDHAVDLVLATAWLKQPVAIFLNDGHGDFSRVEPSVYPRAFADSTTSWSSASTQASGSVGIPPQPRPGFLRRRQGCLVSGDLRLRFGIVVYDFVLVPS